MAAVVGKDGWVSLGTTATTDKPTFFDSWTLNAGVGTADITAYGDNSRAFSHTIREWSVSVTGTFDRSDTHQDSLMDIFDTTSQSSLQIRMFTGSTEYWRGTILPTGLTINSAEDDKVSFSAELQGSSNLSYITTGLSS